MIINGIDRKFRLTVGAAMDIAEMCPGKDISKIESILQTDDTTQQMKAIAKVAIIMNRWAIKCMPKEERPEELTLDELYCLSFEEFTKLSDAIQKGFETGQKTNVKAKPAEKKKDE